ncbi:MAG: asparagine synthase (glutamine-hydrolyzing) [Thermoanaerobaculia bacterium]
MCGICGIFQTSSGAAGVDEARPDPRELARVLAALAPRGPDGEGSWSSPRGELLLGHRRLAILDLSAGGFQPKHDRSGELTLVFNGEIYNFRELRERLQRDGAELDSQSDSEVILELFRRQGVAAFAELAGMFALAIWDELAGELYLARDAYGIRPLYYAASDGTVRFASQVRALDAGGGISTEVDPAAVAGFLSWGAVPEPLTLRKAIRAVPAGHWMRFSRDGAMKIHPLARPDSAESPQPADAGSAIEESLRRHLVSDVPVGLFLSAGLDSTLLAALAARVARERRTEAPQALTLTWLEASGTAADEEPLARATAAVLGLRHFVRKISGEEIRAELPKILAAMDQPSIDGFNTWLVARFARERGLKVALSGLGGDEVFGGYSSFDDIPRWQRRASALARVPGLAAVWPHAAKWLTPRRPKMAGVLRYGGSFAGSYLLRRALYLPDEVHAMLAGARLVDGEKIEKSDRRGTGYDAAFDTWERLSETALGDPPAHLLHDPWQVVQRLESTMYLRHQLLRDADWAGLAHGVEIRTPLVDARLRQRLGQVNFEPARSQGKAALVQSLAPELPAEIFARKKSGFQLPIADWLEPMKAGKPTPVGEQSRRLARIVLGEFGVALGS